MIERAPGITRLLDRLEAKKLARRVRCKDDRRQVLCRIRPAGLELLARLDSGMAAAGERLLDRLSRAQLQTLIQLLDAVRAASAR
jgi:DNA-binding MarR family transcriptional regulator